MYNKNKKSNKEMAEPLGSNNDDSIKSDVNGSYTGYPEDGGQPIQDADDL